MTQAGKAVINQQAGTKGGASGDDLGAPFSLPALSKSAFTHHRPRPAVVLPPAAVRSPGAAPPGRPVLPVYNSRRQQRLVHRTQPRRSLGAWGASATNKRHRVYACALFAMITMIGYVFSVSWWYLSIISFILIFCRLFCKSSRTF